MLDQLSKADFAQNLNTVFTCFIGPDQKIDLELVELREGRSSPRQEQFALTFYGPLALPLPQHTYEFQHATLGEFALFLVPVGKDAQGYYYEAVFNRLLSAAFGLPS
jgi:hypothetical protein